MSGHFGRSLSLFTNSKISNYLRSREFEDGGGWKATIGVVDLLRSNWVFNTGSKIEIDKIKSWTSWDTMQSKHVTQLKIGGKLTLFHHLSMISGLQGESFFRCLCFCASACRLELEQGFLILKSWANQGVFQCSKLLNSCSGFWTPWTFAPLNAFPGGHKRTPGWAWVRLHHPTSVCQLPWAWLVTLAISLRRLHHQLSPLPLRS